jgi:hypothetical protein
MNSKTYEIIVKSKPLVNDQTVYNKKSHNSKQKIPIEYCFPTMIHITSFKEISNSFTLFKTTKRSA